MKKYLYYLAALATLTVIACQQETTPKDEEQDDNGVEFIINSDAIVPAEGAEALEFNVISNVPFAAEIDLADQEWISLVEPAKADASLSSVTFKIEPQEDVASEQRSAKIVFKNTATGEYINTKSSILTITQVSGKGVAVSITQPGVVEYYGAIADYDNLLEVDYKSNVEIVPVLNKDVEWIAWDEEDSEYEFDDEKGTGEGTFVFAIAPNTSYKERRDTLAVKRLDADDKEVIAKAMIIIVQEPFIGEMYVYDYETDDYDSHSNLIIAPDEGEADLFYFSTCAVTPYFLGETLEYEADGPVASTDMPGYLEGAFAFAVPENTSEKAVHYTVNFVNADPKTSENAPKAKKTIELIRSTVTGEIVSFNILVQAPMTDFTIDAEAAFELQYGKSVTINPTFTPEGAAEGREILWASSDETIMKVKDGVVTAVGTGTATITATVEEIERSCEITVPWAVTLDQEEATIVINEKLALTATFVPEELSAVKTIEWSSSDETVATVDENGVVTAVGLGDAVITASSEDKSASCAITVEPWVYLLESDFGDEDYLAQLTYWDLDGDGFIWEIDDWSGQGNYGLWSYSYDNDAGVLTPDNVVIFPSVILGTEWPGYVDFYICGNRYLNEHVGLYVAEAGTESIDDFTLIAEFDLPNNSNFQHLSLEIPQGFEGKEVVLALRHFESTDGYFVVVPYFDILYGDINYVAPTSLRSKPQMNSVIAPVKK